MKLKSISLVLVTITCTFSLTALAAPVESAASPDGDLSASRPLPSINETDIPKENKAFAVYRQVFNLLEEGKPDEAVTIATAYLDTNPGDGLLYYARALAKASKEPLVKPYLYDGMDNEAAEKQKLQKFIQKYTDAIDDIDNAMKLLGPAPYLYNSLGECNYKIENYKNAIEAYKASFELDPSNALVPYWMGMSYYGDSKFYEAIKWFSRAIEKGDAELDGLRWRGKSYEELGDIPKAKKDYMAVALKYPNAYIYEPLVMYNRSKNYSDAIEFYTSILAKNKNNANYYTARGGFYSKLQKYDKAASDYSKAISLKPNDALPYNYRGLAYQKMKKYEDARRDLTLACNKESYLCSDLDDLDRDEARGDKWIFFAESGSDKFYYLKKEIVWTKPRIFKVWVRFEPHLDPFGERGKSKNIHGMTLWEVNCSTKESRTLSNISYEGEKSGNRYDVEKPVFRSISPESIVESLYEKGCSATAKKTKR